MRHFRGRPGGIALDEIKTFVNLFVVFVLKAALSGFGGSSVGYEVKDFVLSSTEVFECVLNDLLAYFRISGPPVVDIGLAIDAGIEDLWLTLQGADEVFDDVMTTIPSRIDENLHFRAFGKLAFETEGLGELTEIADAVCIDESLFELSEVDVARVVANDIEHVNQGVVVDLEQSDGQDERVVDAEGKLETYRLRQCPTNQGSDCYLHLLKGKILCSMVRHDHGNENDHQCPYRPAISSYLGH